MDANEVKNALQRERGRHGDRWIAIRATKLSERAYLVFTHLLANSTEQDICEAILIHNNPDTARREPFEFEIRAAKQDMNISLGAIAHVFNLFVYQRDP
jgi:hypothetical protein